MMMPSENSNPAPAPKQATVVAAKEDNAQASSGANRKAAAGSLRPPEQALNCPRCDSSNTKFCYYNNYSLSQPRHFCKACRRYWTKGGALRNVPIGGGCRKAKKTKPSSSAASRLSACDSKEYSSASSDHLGGFNFKFFQNLPPSVDFQLGAAGLSSLNLAGHLQYPVAYNNQFSNAFSTVSGLGADQQSGGFGFGGNHPLASPSSIGFAAGATGPSSLASSIESLSCINQDLHWKLQQQRYASMALGSGGNDRQKDGSPVPAAAAAQLIEHPTAGPVKPQISGLLRNLEVSRSGDSRREGAGGSGGTARDRQEWFFEGNAANINDSFTPAVLAPAAAAAAPEPNGEGFDAGVGSGGAMSNWNGIQAWNDLQQYSSLPQ